MDETTKIALITGFGGVVLGGFITYFSEWHFRRQERKSIDRKNFILCLCEVERLVNDLTSIYSSSITTFPVERPPLISTIMRSFASYSSIPSTLETDKLFSASHKKDQLFSDISLFFRRFNASLSTFEAMNTMKKEIRSKWLADGISTPTGAEDLVEVSFDITNSEAVADLVTIENLHRDFFRYLVRDISSGRSILKRLNKNSERKFKGVFKRKYPKFEFVDEFTPLDYLTDMPRFSIMDLTPVTRQT